MLALYIILGIFALITLILCINFVVVVDYDDVLKVHASWLFLKFPLFPKKEKPIKEEKESKKSEKKKEKDITEPIKEEKAEPLEEIAEPVEETAEKMGEKAETFVVKEDTEEENEEKDLNDSKEPLKEEKEEDKSDKSKTPAPKKDKKKPKKQTNPFIIFYEEVGFDGIVNILHHTVDALGGLFKGLYRHLVVREAYIDILVTGKDSADTALKYGSVCQKVFPAFGFICSNMKVLKYNIEINPDFLGGKDEVSYYLVLSMKPLFLIWFLLVAVFKLGFNVVLKFFLQARPKKQAKAKTKQKTA